MTAKLDLSFFKTMKTTPVVKRLEYKDKGWKAEMVFPDKNHIEYWASSNQCKSWKRIDL